LGAPKPAGVRLRRRGRVDRSCLNEPSRFVREGRTDWNADLTALDVGF
jgi:hypothetical protein